MPFSLSAEAQEAIDGIQDAVIRSRAWNFLEYASRSSLHDAGFAFVARAHHADYYLQPDLALWIWATSDGDGRLLLVVAAEFDR